MSPVSDGNLTPRWLTKEDDPRTDTTMHLLFLDESGQLTERRFFALGGVALRDRDWHALRDLWQTTLAAHTWPVEREVKWHGIRTGEGGASPAATRAPSWSNFTCRRRASASGDAAPHVRRSRGRYRHDDRHIERGPRGRSPHREAPPEGGLMFPAIGVALAAYTTYSAWTGRVYARSGARGRTVSREKSPVYFWAVIAVYAGLSIALVTVF